MVNNSNNKIRPSVFTTTLLLVVVILFLFNFNFDVFNAGAVVGQITGEGNVGFIPKWILDVKNDIRVNNTAGAWAIFNNGPYASSYGRPVYIAWQSSDATTCTVTSFPNV